MLVFQVSVAIALMDPMQELGPIALDTIQTDNIDTSCPGLLTICDFTQYAIDE